MGLNQHFNAWIVDYMILARTDADLLRRFFEMYRKRNLLVAFPKPNTSLSRVTWCETIANANDIRILQRNTADFKSSHPPRSESELYEYVNRVSSSI